MRVSKELAPPSRNSQGFSRFRLTIEALALVFLACVAMRSVARIIRVRVIEGPTHAFLVLQTLDGKTIAEGDLIETLKGVTVKTETVLHFYDGSFYDETTEFSERADFRFLNDHLTQKGPSFKQQMERSINGSTGQVTVNYTDDKGQQKQESQHMKLPDDIANGMFLTLIKNIDPSKSQTSVTVVAGAPKPRLVQVIITLQGKAPFLIGKSKREGMEYDLKPKIEGAAGVIAPLIGKQPPDTHVWVLGGESPVVLKSEGPLEPDGPIWRMQNVGPSWPSDLPQAQSSK